MRHFWRSRSPGLSVFAVQRLIARRRPTEPSAAIVAAVCVAEILGVAGYSIVPALLPQFIDAWSLTNAQAGVLAGALFGGYMLGVIPLVSLTDHQSARRIYLASSALSTFSCFGVALCDDLLPAIGFRALAGAALAGMYMPGLRALTDGVEGARRARFAAWYTSSFIIGASLSFLLGRVGTLFGWRSAFIWPSAISANAIVRSYSSARLVIGKTLDCRLVVGPCLQSAARAASPAKPYSREVNRG